MGEINSTMKLLIVGFRQPNHMGNYLVCAARQLGLDYQIIDASDAEASSRIGRSFEWRMCGKRPARLQRFGRRVIAVCTEIRPDVVLSTGCAPLDRSHIIGLRELGTSVINYSTDDAWNPAMRASWFLSALPAYDAVFTTRQANLADFRHCGVRSVPYLPFAYD